MSNVSTSNDWTQPAAKAIPKEGYFTLEQGRYGPQPRKPACHGLTIIAKIKAGTEPDIRAYDKRIEDTTAAGPMRSLHCSYTSRTGLRHDRRGFHFASRRQQSRGGLAE